MISIQQKLSRWVNAITIALPGDDERMLFDKKAPPIQGFSGEYAFLSNFYPVPITYLDTSYPTTEHAYQAQKTTDLWIRKRIASLPSPGAAKKYGQKIALVPNYWDTVKKWHMQNILRIKFQDPVLKKQLLDTGKAYLEETNYWGDIYWGVCNGRGKNMLGQLLMEIREELSH